MLTNERAQQDYVKAIYQLGAGRPVTAADLARYLGVSRAAVTKFRRVLAARGLAVAATTRTEPIRLTRQGVSLATSMLRRHRLVETFLHQSLGVPLDVLHAQAESIEHVISDDLADRLDRFLGRPRVDPHGHPISARRERSGRRNTLSAARTGAAIRIAGIPDRDAAVVRRLVSERVLPGLVARVERLSNGNVTLRSRRAVHHVPAAVAETVDVELLRGRQ